MAQEILDKIASIQAEAAAKEAQVNERLGELESKIEALEAQAEEGLSKPEIMEALAQLKLDVQDIYVPVFEVDAAPTDDETLEPTFETDPIVTDDTSGIELADVPEPPMVDDDVPE